MNLLLKLHNAMVYSKNHLYNSHQHSIQWGNLQYHIFHLLYFNVKMFDYLLFLFLFFLFCFRLYLFLNLYLHQHEDIFLKILWNLFKMSSWILEYHFLVFKMGLNSIDIHLCPRNFIYFQGWMWMFLNIHLQLNSIFKNYFFGL